MKNWINNTPLLRSIAKVVYFTIVAPLKSFPGSEEYWKQRYKSGANSGPGSYNKFAEFKAEVLNTFVKDNRIETVIEYGCGDGNQLKLSLYPSYLGFDVSADAISRCKNLFSSDGTKTFKLINAYADESADLTLSLDVIYHLTEDSVFHAYMERLFDSSRRYVIVYSSNTNEQERLQAKHVRHREFSQWVDANKPQWKLVRHIPTKYSQASALKSWDADFYVYEKTR